MNILLIQLKRIGDLILTTPAIAAVGEKFPRADLTLIVAGGTRELLPAIRGLDHTFIARGRISDAASWFQVARRKYDYCLDFTRTDRSAFLTMLSGAKERITADHPKQREKFRARSYNQAVDLSIGSMHTVDYHLGLLDPLGIQHASPRLQLDLPPAAEERATQILAQSDVRGNFVLFHPGSARAEKFWEPANWAALVEEAARHELPVIVTGGRNAAEREHIQEIRQRSRQAFVDLSGRVDLLTLAALIKRARLLVTVDSAPVHFAAAFQTPQVALFGPTNPMHWHPRFTPAKILLAGLQAPLTEFSRKQRPAEMNLISTEQVIDAMKALLAVPRETTV